MAHVKIMYDYAVGTLWACWDDPHKAYICSDIDYDTILIKDKAGNVLGFENMSFPIVAPEDFSAEVVYDDTRNALTIWHGNKADEFGRDAPVDKVVIIKDKQGQPIGVEKLDYILEDPNDLQVEVEKWADPHYLEILRPEFSSTAAPDR